MCHVCSYELSHLFAHLYIVIFTFIWITGEVFILFSLHHLVITSLSSDHPLPPLMECSLYLGEAGER